MRKNLFKLIAPALLTPSLAFAMLGSTDEAVEPVFKDETVAAPVSPGASEGQNAAPSKNAQLPASILKAQSNDGRFFDRPYFVLVDELTFGELPKYETLYYFSPASYLAELIYGEGGMFDQSRHIDVRALSDIEEQYKESTELLAFGIDQADQAFLVQDWKDLLDGDQRKQAGIAGRFYYGISPFLYQAEQTYQKPAGIVLFDIEPGDSYEGKPFTRNMVLQAISKIDREIVEEGFVFSANDLFRPAPGVMEVDYFCSEAMDSYDSNFALEYKFNPVVCDDQLERRDGVNVYDARVSGAFGLNRAILGGDVRNPLDKFQDKLNEKQYFRRFDGKLIYRTDRGDKATAKDLRLSPNDSEFFYSSTVNGIDSIEPAGEITDYYKKATGYRIYYRKPETVGSAKGLLSRGPGWATIDFADEYGYFTRIPENAQDYIPLAEKLDLIAKRKFGYEDGQMVREFFSMVEKELRDIRSSGADLKLTDISLQERSAITMADLREAYKQWPIEREVLSDEEYRSLKHNDKIKYQIEMRQDTRRGAGYLYQKHGEKFLNESDYLDGLSNSNDLRISGLAYFEYLEMTNDNDLRFASQLLGSDDNSKEKKEKEALAERIKKEAEERRFRQRKAQCSQIYGPAFAHLNNGCEEFRKKHGIVLEGEEKKEPEKQEDAVAKKEEKPCVNVSSAFSMVANRCQ